MGEGSPSFAWPSTVRRGRMHNTGSFPLASGLQAEVDDPSGTSWNRFLVSYKFDIMASGVPCLSLNMRGAMWGCNIGALGRVLYCLMRNGEIEVTEW